MKVLITGGGTGGHIYPALAIAQNLQKANPSVEFLFVGTERGLEKEIIPKAGLPFTTITVEGLPRKLSLASLRTGFKLLKGLWQARKILKEFKPTVVVGTGGYVCGPVVAMAAWQGIPTLVHEQNAFPGITNRLLAKWVNKIAVTYQESAKYFPGEKVVLTGNPIRPEVISASRAESLVRLGLDAAKKTVLIFGGSRGARSINQALMLGREVLQTRSDLQVIHITGKEDFSWASCQNGMEEVKFGNIIVKPYLHNMPDALAVADLVVCRSGATTLAEITVRGIPAILIPYPFATDNHQEFNARSLAKEGAAVMLLDRELKEIKLEECILELIDDENRLRIMAQKSRDLGKPEAAQTIVDCLYSLLRV